MGVELHNPAAAIRFARLGNIQPVRFQGKPPVDPAAEPAQDEVELRSRQSLLSLSLPEEKALGTLREVFKTLTPETLQRLDRAGIPPVDFMKAMTASGLSVVSVPVPELKKAEGFARNHKPSGLGRLKARFSDKVPSATPVLSRVQQAVPKTVADQLGRMMARPSLPEDSLRSEFVAQGYGRAQALAAVELAREVGMDVATFLGVNSGLGGEIISKVGTLEQQAFWLNAMNEGHMTYAFGLTEPTAGSDPRSMQTTYRVEKRNGQKVYVLNGAKKFIGNAAQVKDPKTGEVIHRGADFIVIFAVDDPKKPPEQRSYRAFMVPRTAIGEENIAPTGGDAGKLGLKVVNNGDITLKNVEVPESFVLGDPNRNMYPLLLKTLDETRLFVGAMGVGMAEAFVNDTRAYTAQRTQYGKPIQGHQSVNRRTNEVAAKTLVAKLLLMDAAQRIDEAHAKVAAGEKPASFKNYTSMAKLFSTEVAKEAGDVNITNRGGNGFLEDLSLNNGMAKRWRDTQVLCIYEGTSDIQRNVIAQGEIIQAGKAFAAQYDGLKTKASYLFHKLTGTQERFEAASLDALIGWLKAQPLKTDLAAADTPQEAVEAAYEAARHQTLPRFFEAVKAEKLNVQANGLPDKWKGWDASSINRELEMQALGRVQLRMHALADLAMQRHLTKLASDELEINRDPEQQMLLNLFLRQAATEARQSLAYLDSEQLALEENLHQAQNE